MHPPNEPVDYAFDRLQHLLLAMRAGDQVDTREASRQTGLSEPTCRIVLERLAGAGLLWQEAGDRFVRVTSMM